MIRDEFHYTLYTKKGNDRPNKVYYYAFYDDDGNRFRKSTGQTVERKARAYVNKLIAEGRFKEHHQIKTVKSPTFQQFAEENHFWEFERCPYVRNAVARKGHFSMEVCKANGDSMRKHIYPTFKNVRLEKISKAMINNWLINLPSKAKISNKTANNMRFVLYSMLEIASDMGLVKRDIIIDKVKPLPKKSKTRPAFTRKQIADLFKDEWPSEIAYIACFLAAFTGMRLGEIRALKASQVLEDRIIVDSSWSDFEGRKGTKSGKERIVPITPELKKMLDSITVNHGYLFTLSGPEPVSGKYITEKLHERMDKLKINHSETDSETTLSFHSFRHFFNTQLVTAGIDGESIRAVIGHEDEKMTENYTHIQIDDKTLSAVRAAQITLIDPIATQNKRA